MRKTLFIILLLFASVRLWSVYNTPTKTEQPPIENVAITPTLLPVATDITGEIIYLPVAVASNTAAAEATATEVPTEYFIRLPDGFAQVHMPFDRMGDVNFNPTVKYVVVTNERGETIERTGAFELSAQTCGEWTRVQLVREYYRQYSNSALRSLGITWRDVASLAVSESTFTQFDLEGGACAIFKNGWGAPAFCMMQIYKPKGSVPAGQEVHPEVSLEELYDPKICISTGLRIYEEFVRSARGDHRLAAACYKGFCDGREDPANDPLFVRNYMTAWNAGGAIDSESGQWISWDETEFLNSPIWQDN